MLSRLVGRISYKERLEFHTTLRVGGPADLLVTPEDVAGVQRVVQLARAEGLALTVLGSGSNVLVADSGIRGVVLKLDCLLGVRFEGDHVLVGAGSGLNRFIRELEDQGLGGLEAFVGLPGTVGGAVATEVAVAGRRIVEHVAAVQFITAEGKLGLFRARGDGSFSLPAGGIITSVQFRVRRRHRGWLKTELKERVRRRRAIEPMGLAAVLVWEDREAAGKLIRGVGCLGKRLNGAEISSKDPAFVVNRGEATAADILALMEIAADRVWAQYGIRLVPLVRILGRQPGTSFHVERPEIVSCVPRRASETTISPVKVSW